MTAALLATVLLSTKAEIGVAAGWALFLLRWWWDSQSRANLAAGGVLLEGASADRRGLVATSMPGIMIAAVAAAVLPVFLTLKERRRSTAADASLHVALLQPSVD